MSLTIDYAGKLWRYNVDDQLIELEGWEPFLLKALVDIASKESIDWEIFQSEVAHGLLAELRRLRPPRPKPKPVKTRVVVHKLLEEELRDALKDPPPPKAVQTYVPLPMARVYRQQAFRTFREFWAWIRKIIRL